MPKSLCAKGFHADDVTSGRTRGHPASCTHRRAPTRTSRRRTRSTIMSERVKVLRRDGHAVTGRVVDEAGPAAAGHYRPPVGVIGLAIGELLYVRRRADISGISIDNARSVDRNLGRRIGTRIGIGNYLSRDTRLTSDVLRSDLTARAPRRIEVLRCGD